MFILPTVVTNQHIFGEYGSALWLGRVRAVPDFSRLICPPTLNGDTPATIWPKQRELARKSAECPCK